MSHRYHMGLTPTEIEFLCELEVVTVIPRRKLEPLPLLSGLSPALRPPHRVDVPLWLALLLKRQRRVDVVPPSWLHPTPLNAILERELSEDRDSLFTPPPPLLANTLNTPPFQRSSTAAQNPDALPYHWLELGHVLLNAAPEDVIETEQVRRLLRDIREVRFAKLRALMSKSGSSRYRATKGETGSELDPGAGLRMDGIGAMEISEARAFISGVVDGLRRITASREASERERVEEELQDGKLGQDYDNEDDDMLM